jgi:hypothetical protein
MDLSTSSRARSRVARAVAAEAPDGALAAAAYVPLDIHARIASPPPVDASWVLRRFALQSAARELLPRERVSACLRRPIPGREAVDLLYVPTKQSAHYGGLQVCGSVWCCPVCAAKVSERRRVELHTGIRAWLGISELEGGDPRITNRGVAGERRLLLCTFTLQHSPSEPLSAVLGRLTAARRHLMSGKAAQVFQRRYGVRGHIRSLEITHGENGWHPHLHVLMFFDGEVPIIPFREELGVRWLRSVAAVGGYASLAAFDVRFSDQEIVEYVSKFGKEPRWTSAHEMTKGVTKVARRGGRTPMQLLADYFDQQDTDAGRLWLQYAVTMKGERQLWWSHGLRDLLGLTTEKSDEEIATQQDEIAVQLARLSLYQWRVIVANDARGDLLQVARSGDSERVRSFLYSLGIA